MFLKTLSLTLLACISLVTAEEQAYQIIPDKSELKILTPSLSQQKTVKLRLNNGLEALLISDPGVDQSCAALSVTAGSWQDPKEYPGMAHFCEHMLFMGTEAYPKEFEYMQYITDNGGSVNAATWPDHTIYGFSINNAAFENALDRFSHFFIDPIFSTSSINRELHAVDQEHSKNIENDNWRTYMILKETGNPNHPNAGFSTGNAKTLSGIPQKALKDWYQRNYNARDMHLFVVTPLPMEQMISYIVNDFSKIKNNDQTGVAITEPMLSQNQLGHFIYIKPVKDLKQLNLVWEVPTTFNSDQAIAAIDLVAYALQAEGPKSLIENLKKEKLAEKINVDLDRMSKDQSLFQIDIHLTPEGVGQTDKVLQLVFEAIAGIKQKGIPQPIFEQLKQTALFRYEYQSRDDAFSYAMDNGNAMIYENLETYPKNTLQPISYDPKLISNFTDSLTAQNCIFFVIADPAKTKVAPTKKEKWMQAEYTVNAVPEKRLVALSQTAPVPQIDLPGLNPFVPAELKLQKTEVLAQPVLIADDASAKIYYNSDHTYLIPEVSVIFGLKSPELDGSAKKTALTSLYIKSLKEQMAQALFFANVAGLHPTFSQDHLSFKISVQGFSEKAPLLVKEIFQNLKQVKPSEQQFAIFKESLLSNYDNASKELPVAQAKELLASIISSDSPSNSEKYKALKDISYAEFLQFSADLFKTAYLEGILYGNLTQTEAEAIAKSAKETLGYTPFPKEKQYKREFLKLPEKNGPFLIKQHTERQGNGIVLLLEEGNFTFEKRAAQQVLSKALSEAFFDTLRTKQQTAYFARAWDTEEERHLFQFFAVQSSTHDPRDLLARFDLFLEGFVKNFEITVPEERFQALREMLVVTLEMPPENLLSMGERLFTLAFKYEGDFNWYEKRVASVKALTYDELTKACVEFLSRENAKRIAVIFEGVLAPENDFHYESVTKDDLKTIGTYSQFR